MAIQQTHVYIILDGDNGIAVMIYIYIYIYITTFWYARGNNKEEYWGHYTLRMVGDDVDVLLVFAHRGPIEVAQPIVIIVGGVAKKCNDKVE